MPDNDLKINISVAARLEALHAMENELQKQIVKFQILGKSKDEIAGLETKLGKVREQLQGIGILNRVGGESINFLRQLPVLGPIVQALNGAAGAWTLFGTAVGAGGAAAQKAVAAFEQAEQRLVGLRAALALGGQANAANEASLLNLVSAQKSFAIAGSESLPVIETLLKLGRVRAEDVPKEFEAVKGLAAITGQDLTSAAHLYSIALEGNITRLQRWMPELRTCKTEEEKLAMARERLTEAAKAYNAQAETEIGTHKKLEIAMGDVLARTGEFFAYGKTVKWLAECWNAVADHLPAVHTNIQPVNSALAHSKQIADEVAAALKKIGVDAKEALGENPGDELGAGLDAVGKKADAVNKKLEETRRLNDGFRDAQTQVAIANLRLAEDQALASAKTPEDKHIIEKQFAEKRRQVEDEAKLDKLNAELADAKNLAFAAEKKLGAETGLRNTAVADQTTARGNLERFQAANPNADGLAGQIAQKRYTEETAKLVGLLSELASIKARFGGVGEVGRKEAEVSAQRAVVDGVQTAGQAAQAQTAELARLKTAVTDADTKVAAYSQVVETGTENFTTLNDQVRLLTAKISAQTTTSQADKAAGQRAITEAQQAAKDKAATAAAEEQKKAKAAQASADKEKLHRANEARTEEYRKAIETARDAKNTEAVKVLQRQAEDFRERVRQDKPQPGDPGFVGPVPRAATAPAPLPNLQQLQAAGAQALREQDTAGLRTIVALESLVKELTSAIKPKADRYHDLENQIRQLASQLRELKNS